MSADTEYALRREAEAAKSLLSNLGDHAEDEDVVADAIEGETGLVEAIEAALSEMDECDVMETGLSAKIKQFTDRKRRVEDRKSRIRAAIEQALLVTEQPSMRLAGATLTIAKVAPGLIVQNEADIPASFFTEQERPAPKLDKRAVLDALKSKQQVPGCTLDNGGVRLHVRRT